MQSFLESVGSTVGNAVNAVSVMSGKKSIDQQTLDNNVLISLMDQLHKVNMEPDCSLEIPCPHIAVIGDQGLGKSTTLNRLLGHEILPMRQSNHESSICTLFPTIYHTIYDPECKNYTVELWCKRIGQADQLVDTVQALTFEDIKTIVKTKFADCYVKSTNIETVRVVVKGARLSSKYVVDLPGIRNDNSEQANKIRDQIINYLDKNPGTILLFFLPSSGPERTSAWSIVNKYTQSNTIVPVLIRPDQLGSKDKSVMNVLSGKTDIKLPNENVFVVKNPDTLNNEVFDLTRTDQEEAIWFEQHPIYGKYVFDPSFNKKFGFNQLVGKVVDILNARYCSIMPKIIEKTAKKLQEYQLQRSQLKTKLVINDGNKLLIYKSFVDEFLNRVRGVISGEASPNSSLRLGGASIKLKIKEFYDKVSAIKYTGTYNVDEIDVMISQCGGSKDLYTKFNEETLINILFRDPKSPAKQLDSLIKEYIDIITKLFKDIIYDIDFSHNPIDIQFWNSLKDRFIQDVDKKYVQEGLIMLCSAQEAYFEFEDQKPVQNGQYSGSNMPTIAPPSVTSTKYVLSIMEGIWNKYSVTVKQQFGKYIQKHFVEHNLNGVKMDSIFYKSDNIDAMARLLKEPESVEKRRVFLDRNIEKLKGLSDIINKIRL